jgi:hypothetical protein
MRIEAKYKRDQSPLYKLSSRSKLAGLLGLSVGELRRLLKTTDALYSEFNIPKRDGGLRHVENPARPLKLAQAKLARFLGRIAPPDYLFCPVKGRCYVTNAAQHRGNRVVHCLDVRKYFPSTPTKRVFWFFRSVMKCERDIAGALARLATFQGHLPTGSPLSPIMAHFAYVDIWERISEICRKNGYCLTVYIDDVTVSANSVDPAVLWEIKRAIHGAGLKYHKERSFHDRPAEITGVIVRGDQMLVPNRQLQKLVLTRTALADADEADQEVLNKKLTGIRGQIQQIARANR